MSIGSIVDYEQCSSVQYWSYFIISDVHEDIVSVSVALSLHSEGVPVETAIQTHSYK